MNVKYNELYQYITNNKGKALDDCDVFDVLKYDNFNYFFIANSSKIKFTRDKEEIKYCSELINESFENEVNNYPIITNKNIPVINIYFDKKKIKNHEKTSKDIKSFEVFLFLAVYTRIKCSYINRFSVFAC